MASKFANDLYEMLEVAASRSDELDVIDGELSEVREVLEMVTVIPTACAGGRGQHSPTCLAVKQAKALLKRLAVT